jgi:immune inhibitor A
MRHEPPAPSPTLPILAATFIGVGRGEQEDRPRPSCSIDSPPALLFAPRRKLPISWRNRVRKLVTVLATLALTMSLIVSPAAAKSNGKADQKTHGDNFPGKLAQKQQGLKQKALDLVAKGKATPKGANQVVKVANGQYVELAFEGEDQILTLLGEFGPLQNNSHAGHPAHNGAPGPLHNAIPEPNRTTDNTTIWTADFSQSYYDHLLYDKGQRPSMANWYLEQSYGRYSVDGYVSDWVQVPYNEAAYGSNYCGSIVCTRDIGRFLVDQSTAWYNAMVAAGNSGADIDALLAPFDVWDRYDYDGDGDFNEPDGYIDHFQSVHAGEGEETGGGAQGTDAIWSHRSYANPPAGQGPGPVVTDDDGNPVVVPFGGIHIGGSSKWIGDYTIEPENGGVGVFSHEFGHDLGLPDEYDTSGNTGGAENSTAWWTPWSQGSYGTISNDLGTYPVEATAWERIFLGWSNYAIFGSNQKASVKLSASTLNTKQNQSLVVVLPDKETSVFVGDPYAGSQFYHSGSGNDLDNSMTRPISLGAGPIGLSFKARYEIEGCWDYAYVEVSTDGGSTFEPIATSASTDDDENGQNFGHGITGTSGNPKTCDQLGTQTASWVDVTADLSAYANSTIQLRFRYWTDGAAVGDGIGIDDIAITGLATDGAETDAGWTYDGFVRTTGTVTSTFANYYIAEYRAYGGYDKALQAGPYQFTDPAGNWVEHFPYQDGLLIWYYDTSQADNNVGDHPGAGLILPIDAHPDIRHWSDGTNGRPRLQSYDSTFGLDKTDAITVHSVVNGTFSVPSQPAAKVFNDNNSYYRASDPADGSSFYQAGWSSVNHPHTGTVIKVSSVSSTGFMQVLLNP